MAKNGQPPPKARRVVRKKFSLPERSHPKDTLSLDFLLPEPRENVVLSHLTCTLLQETNTRSCAMQSSLVLGRAGLHGQWDIARKTTHGFHRVLSCMALSGSSHLLSLRTHTHSLERSVRWGDSMTSITDLLGLRTGHAEADLSAPVKPRWLQPQHPLGCYLLRDPDSKSPNLSWPLILSHKNCVRY